MHALSDQAFILKISQELKLNGKHSAILTFMHVYSGSVPDRTRPFEINVSIGANCVSLLIFGLLIFWKHPVCSNRSYNLVLKAGSNQVVVFPFMLFSPFQFVAEIKI